MKPVELNVNLPVDLNRQQNGSKICAELTFACCNKRNFTASLKALPRLASLHADPPVLAVLLSSLFQAIDSFLPPTEGRLARAHICRHQ